MTTVQDLIDYCNKHNLPLTTPVGNSDHFGDYIESDHLSHTDFRNESKGFIDLNIADRGEEPD